MPAAEHIAQLRDGARTARAALGRLSLASASEPAGAPL